MLGKSLVIISLVVMLMGLSLVPMADAKLRQDKPGDVFISEEERQVQFKTCLSKIPTDATFVEKITAKKICNKILTSYFVGSRTWNTIIDDHKFYVRKCINNYDTFQFTGEILLKKVLSSPRFYLCMKMYNDPVWLYQGEDRLIQLAIWYNNEVIIAKEILDHRDRNFYKPAMEKIFISQN